MIQDKLLAEYNNYRLNWPISFKIQKKMLTIMILKNEISKMF